MRPIDLIPPEERSDRTAPLRSGPLAYILVAALVAALVGVTALVLTNNQIDERKSDLARVEHEDAAARARAKRLSAYTQFRTMQERRLATVTSLADSRFDWERVMRELSLVLPSNVWLVGLTATATPGVSVQGGSTGGSSLRTAAPGPALELSGCASGQEAVADFVTALKDIDGVTRVGVQSSQLAGHGSGNGGGEEGGGTNCQTRSFIAKFEIVVAFDAAPIPPSSEGSAPPAAEAEATTTSTGSGESPSASSSEGEGG